MPSYMRLLTRTAFPRTQVTIRPTGRGIAFGPFRSRASAEEFEKATLELFQVRRCQDDLDPNLGPSRRHLWRDCPCLRPCQDAVTRDEYASEVERLVEFLSTERRSLTETVERMHPFQRRHGVRRSGPPAPSPGENPKRLATPRRTSHRRRDHERRSRPKLPTPNTVTLIFLLDGAWQTPIELNLLPADGHPISLDRRLRELVDERRP